MSEVNGERDPATWPKGNLSRSKASRDHSPPCPEPALFVVLRGMGFAEASITPWCIRLLARKIARMIHPSI